MAMAMNSKEFAKMHGIKQQVARDFMEADMMNKSYKKRSKVKSNKKWKRIIFTLHHLLKK